MSPEPQFILVTGATGFLGSHLVQQLLEGGYRVRCTARPLKSRFLEAAHFEPVRVGQLEIVEVHDLALGSLERVLTGITAVIHTAFPAPGSMDDTELLLNATSSTTSLLRQAYEHGIRKFVLTSSYLAMVGAGASADTHNEKGEGANSNSVWSDYVFSDQDWTRATYGSVFTGTNDPAWAYAAAKTLTEAAAWDFASARPDFDLATVLPTLLIGPFSPGHPILSTNDLSTNVLLYSLLTSGTPPHPVWPHFVDVRDVARAHVKALEAPSLSGSTAPSSQSGLGKGTGTGKGRALDLPPISWPAHPTFHLPSFNPSLVDLGTTLQDSETSFQSTLESPPSLFSVMPQSASTSVRADAQGPASPLRQDPSELSSPNSPMSMSRSARVQPRTPPRKRFIATGASFTWPDAISHLRVARPDLSPSLPDERACLPIPETVAGVEGGWSGAAWASAVGLRADGVVHSHSHLHAEDESEGGGEEARGTMLEGGHGPVWSGLDIRWRDWRETVEDAVRDLECVAGGLEKSGWEDLFGEEEEEDDDENENQQAKEDNQGKGS